MDKSSVFIPCEPFEGVMYDATKARMVKGTITGYQVAIRDFESFEMPHLLHPITIESGAKHGIIAVPVMEASHG